MNFFEISYYVLIGVLGTMALVLFVLPMRKDVRLEGYNVSLKLMALSFLALSLYCTFKWAVPQEMFNVYFLFMSHLQANLLGLGHINLLTPKKVSKTYVLYHFVPLLLCTAIYGTTQALCPRQMVTDYGMLADPALWTSPEWLVRCAWMAIYVGTTAYFGIVFFREFRRYESKADNYFSEPAGKGPRIIRISFIFALLVATTTLFITSSLNPLFSAALNMCILALYTMMGVFYIQYPTVFPTLEPVIYGEEPAEDTPSDKAQWQELKKRILDEELYLKSGVTMEQLAREMHVSRNRLSAMINRYETVNFNCFINQLRIRRACEMLDSNPAERAAELAERLGYSEQSNFARNFKLYTGKTPKEYVQKG